MVIIILTILLPTLCISDGTPGTSPDPRGNLSAAWGYLEYKYASSICGTGILSSTSEVKSSTKTVFHHD